ncbi:MAG: ATP-binding protein [Bacteroidales bacterium]|nr:ATP-binding protein [Bacteroidales bacterium]
MIKKDSFNTVINFFKKDIDFTSDIEEFRTQSLIRFILIGIILLILFMIKTIAVGTYSSLYVQFVFLFILFASLFLFKLRKHRFVGNTLSLLIIIMEIASVFFNFSGDIPMNFMIDEFYLFLAFLVFTPMFASKWVVITNTLLVIITSVSAFILKKDLFPPEIVHTAAIGTGVYVLAVIIVFIFSYLYTEILYKAINEVNKKFISEGEKNKELLQNAQMIRLQNEQINLAKEKAEESNRLKSSFLSNMSHEIRTPMNAVLGFTEILKSTELNSKQKEYIKIIETSGKHLLNLINDIIDISKLESNQIRINETKCSINYLLDELKDFFTLDLIRKNKENVKIIMNKGFNEAQDRIYTDNLRLRQILINLISNAVKFTDKGKIEISYTLNQNSMLLFSVKDTGIGIHENDLNMIFERFRQSDETTENKYGGTGLGLAIAKACANLLNGDIWAESRKNQGSVFHFTIPYKPIV